MFSAITHGRLLLAALPLLASSSVPAAEGAIYSAAQHHSAQLMQTALGLLLVLALIGALFWLLKRLPKTRQSTASLRVMASLALSSRERLLVVAVGSEQILLAVSPCGIKRLHRLRESLPEASEGKAGGQFAAQLAALMPSLQRGHP